MSDLKPNEFEYSQNKLAANEYWKFEGNYDEKGRQIFVKAVRPNATDVKPPVIPAAENNNGFVGYIKPTTNTPTWTPKTEKLEELKGKGVEVGKVIDVNKFDEDTKEALPEFFKDEKFLVLKILNDRVIVCLERAKNIRLNFKYS